MLTKEKILVVEDESVTALDIANKLEGMGYTVTGIADNDRTVIDEVEKERPDLALLDIKLKGKSDGIITAEKLRNDYNIPVIFLTAFADDETVERAIKTSPYGYIIKPVDELELYTSIEVAFHKYRVEMRLRKSEERYRSLYSMFRLTADNVPDMIWAKDLEGKFLFTNRAICEILLNAVDTDEPIGKNDMFFAARERNLYPDAPDWHTFGELCVNSDEIIIKSKKPKRFDEFGNVKGKFMFLDVYKAPFRNENGEIIGTVGTARIVTEEKRLEEERKETEKAMTELRRTKDTLTDFVVHDIKNISSAMLAWLEILNDEILGELTREQRDALQRVIESNEELFGLSEEMLDIASVEEGRFDLDKKMYVFEDQVKAIVEQFKPGAVREDKVIRFRQTGGPLIIQGDEYRIKRAVSNLILNAMKFVLPGNGNIFVSVRANEKEGVAVLRVSDNGPGIPGEYHNKIFEKYGQVELKGVGVKKGKGLGLTFCKVVAEAHGGSVAVESDGESGSVFIMKLPLYKYNER